MATGLGTQDAAIRTKDAIEKLALKVINRERPVYRYGTVQTIDHDGLTCTVLFPGESTPVTVRMGAIQPVAEGQVVRVDGIRGDRFVVDVIGQTTLTSVPAADLSATSSFALSPGMRAIVATWNAVGGAYGYEVQLAEDSDFEVNARSFPVTDNRLRMDDLDPDVTYYARVRARNSYGGAGGWSEVKSAKPDRFVGEGDGVAPDSSPAVTCEAGIGFVVASWAPSSNPDDVVYAVYADTESGFEPSDENKVGETSGTFYIVDRLADGTSLVDLYETNVFVRIIEIDPDGEGPASEQGFAAPRKIDTGDVANIAGDRIFDGNAPASSPDEPTLVPGIGFIYASWDHVANDDPVTYEVHISTISGFTPSENTLVQETPSNYTFIRRVGSGAGGGALEQGVTYYVRIVAKDPDGYAEAGTQSTTIISQLATEDVEPQAITTALIADLAVDEAKIANAAITTAKIADLSVVEAKIANAAISSAKIDDLAVIEAKIANAAITTAKIHDLAVTDAKIASLDAAKITTGFLAADRIEARSLKLDKLVIGNFDNLVTDPTFELDDDDTPHSFTNAGGSWAVDDTRSRSGGQSLRYTATSQSGTATAALDGALDTRQGHQVAQQGDKFYFSAYVFPTGTSHNDVRVRLDWRDADGERISVTDSVYDDGDVSSNQWNLLEVTGTAPTDSAYVVFVLVVDNDSKGGDFWFDSMYARRIAGTAIIDDAAITSAKIANLAVNTAQIANAAITSAKIGSLAVTSVHVGSDAIEGQHIADGTITGSHLAVQTIEATHIKAQTITTSQIATQTITATNLANGAVGSNQIGNNAVGGNHIGNQVITGSHIGNSTIGGSNIGNSTITDSHIVNATITSAKIQNLSADKITTGSLSSTTITLSGSNARIVSSSGSLTIAGDGSITCTNVNMTGTFQTANFGGANAVRLLGGQVQIRTVNNQCDLSAAGTGYLGIVGGGVTTLVGNAGTTMGLKNNASGTLAVQQSSTNTIFGGSSTMEFKIGSSIVGGVNSTTWNLDLASSAGAANAVHRDGFGNLFEFTSTIRHKRDVADTDVPIARGRVLAIRPRRFKSALDFDIERFGEDREFLGFVAEELAEVHEDLVTWRHPTKQVVTEELDPWTLEVRQTIRTVPDESKPMEPSSPNLYAILAEAIKVIQDQEERITALEAAIAA